MKMFDKYLTIPTGFRVRKTCVDKHKRAYKHKYIHLGNSFVFTCFTTHLSSLYVSGMLDSHTIELKINNKKDKIK